MRRKTLIAILFVFALFLLAACQPAAPAPVTPSATPETPTPTPETPVTAEPVVIVPVTKEDLGIVGTPFESAFWRMAKLVTREGSDLIVSIDGEKYTLDGGWNTNTENINTLKAIDKDGDQVTLIWNREGLSVNFPLSTDIRNPTKGMNNTNRLTMSQRYKLQHPDPFSKRTEDLTIRYEWTPEGVNIFFRINNGDERFNTKRSEVWIEYTTESGEILLVNPLDFNDIRARRAFMCTHGVALADKANIIKFGNFLEENESKFLVWPILRASKSLFKSLGFPDIAMADPQKLLDLLNSPENYPKNIEFLRRQLERDDIFGTDVKPGDTTGIPLYDEYGGSLLVSEAEEIVYPCIIK